MKPDRPGSPSERRARYVSPEKRRAVEADAEKLLTTGVSKTQILDTLVARHDVGRGAASSAIKRVRERWADEDRENRPGYKASAIRRIQSHIVKARASEQWSAVAQLERLLSEIQGTRDETERGPQLLVSLPEVAMRVLTTMPEDRFKALVEEQKKLLKLAGGKVVETTGETVE